MPNYTATTLSAATNGMPIKIMAIATAGTTIHTATAFDAPHGVDEVWLWAGNITPSAVQGSLYISSDPSGDRRINFRVPAAFHGPIPILAGHRVCDGVVITATASTTEAILIWGNVNRVTDQGT